MRFKELCFVFSALITTSLQAHAQEVIVSEPTGNTPMLSPQESMKTMHLPEGYSLELVVAEPHISEPVVAVFDGNGRLYVAEMRTYMQDADGTGENEPTSRVSWHEDTNGDGEMDQHGVFVDNLLLPRSILPLDDRILIQETHTNDVYAYRDTDGDGTADEKTPFYIGGKRGGNMEHQPSGLVWAMDNGIYTTYNAYRLRYNHNGKTTKEATGYGGGQWGLCQDNYGKPWFTGAGHEIGPLNFQQPIVYGNFSESDEYPPGYREVFPLVGIPDVQGGSKRFRPDNKTLNHFTSTCGQEIFRGDRLPDEMKGDLFFSEPVGRLIRRSEVELRDGMTYLSNAHPKSEFLRSTDPNFRAVNMNNAPDGSLYLVDMYRGIIQQGTWTAPGSYLRKVIEQYGLDKNIGMGRIYRLVHKDHQPDTTKPQMLKETPAQLVAHLSHPNGWWRDTAQKLLILKNDKSVVPALEKIVTASSNELAKHHALWTLQGLEALTPELVRSALQDNTASVRRAALRVAESLSTAGDTSFAADFKAKLNDSDPNVVIQALLSAQKIKLPAHREWIKQAADNSSSKGVKSIANQLLTGRRETPPKLPAKDLAQYKKGQVIFTTLCSSCHGADGTGMKVAGNGTESLLAPSFVNNARIAGHPEVPIKTILHGLTGPLDGVTYTGGMMAPMASNNDEWIANVLSYIRYQYNNRAGFVSADQVKAIRQKSSARKTLWTLAELLDSSPGLLTNKTSWKLSASHNSKDLAKATDGKPASRYSSNKMMKPGMWFQVELPEATNITGIKLDYSNSPNDFPRKYSIEVSADGNKWHTISQGKGARANMNINFKPTAAKFIKIIQKGKSGPYWSIHELNILKTSS